jgi:hypothetical protein
MNVTQKQLEALTDRMARKMTANVTEKQRESIILDELEAFCEAIDPTLESIDTNELLWCVRKIAEIKSRGDDEYYLLDYARKHYPEDCKHLDKEPTPCK